MASQNAMTVTTGDAILELQADAARKRRAELLALKNSGMQVRQIAKKVKLSRQRVHVMLKKAREDVKKNGG